MVLHKYGEKLYSRLVATMTWHLKEISRCIESAQGGLFLEELNRKWGDHNRALQMIRDILMYMDRTFVPSSHKTPVNELGLNLWRDNIIHSSETQRRLLNTLIDCVKKERTGEFINRGLMRNIVKMLMDLGPSVYQQDFEKPFLEVSTNFFRAESQQLVEHCDCGEYDDLGRMYYLFRRVPDGLSMIRDVMSSYLRETGKQLVSDSERLRDPVDFVERLLVEKDKNDKIINISLKNDNTFQNTLNASFEFFINLNTRSP
ncbi:hypothetical protein AAC387_Pa04g3035 [Persea americana]